MVAAPVASDRGLVRTGNFEPELAVGRESSDRLAFIVDAVHRVIGGYEYPVRSLEDAFSPRPFKVAVAIEDQDRRIPSLKDKQPILRVNCDAGRVTQAHMRRKATPAADPPKRECARSNDHPMTVFLSLCGCSRFYHGS